MPRFTITNRQRAPIYEQLRRHIASINDVRVFADADPEEAGRRALQYADDFRLLEDLGWDRDDPRDSIRLTMPPIDLRRALMRLQSEAEGELTSSAEAEQEEKAEHAEIRDEASRPARPAATSSTRWTRSSKGVGSRTPALET